MKTKLTLIMLALFGWSNFMNAQATLFKDLAPGNVSSNPEQFMVVNGTMYFITVTTYKRALWKTDGTEAGTVLVKDDIITTQVGDRFMLRGHMGGFLYYTVNSNVQADVTTELWKTDGGTPVLVDSLTSKMLSGVANGEPRNYTFVNDKLYFQMYTDNGYELWVSDGTAAGTQEVIDLFPGSTSGIGNEGALNTPMIGYNGKVYFRGHTALNSDGELYSSDGTAAGTALVAPTMVDVHPEQFTVYNNELYFFADAGANTGIYKTDGTAAGTVFVAATGFSGAYIFQNNMYYTWAASLWKSDGTTAGTVLVKDSAGMITGATSGSLYTTYMKSLPVAPYFETYFWKSDGTTAGTVRVSDTMGQAFSFAVLNNKMYGARSGTALWETDGTEAGTKKVYDGYVVQLPVVFAGKVFFVTFGNGTAYEPWVLTPSGVPSSVDELADGSDLNIYPNPSNGIFKVAIKQGENTSVQVFNLTGELILNQSNTETIDLTNYPQGMYVVKVIDGQTTHSKRIVKQ